MKRKLTTGCFLFCFLLMLSGCLGKDAEIYKEKDVLEYVESICDEPYELIDKKLIEQEPDNMEYTFQTKERALLFTANSYLNPIWFDATKTSFYNRALSCSYVSAVHNLYLKDLEQVLSACDQYVNSNSLDFLYVIDFEDIDKIVDVISEADEVYKQELEYNSEEFLLENPLRSIQLVWNRNEEEATEHRRWVHITNINITGQNEKEELYEDLAGRYAQLYLDGEIDKACSVPEKYLENRHVTVLPVIELNGNEMFYDSDDSNPYGRFGLTTADYKFCWYNQETESYMMVADIGWITDNSTFPMINREYVNALGGSYEVDKRENQYISSWSIGEDTWTMKSEYSDGEVQSLEIKKNGRPLDISYLTSDEDNRIRASFCIGVTVDDFCELFDLDYRIDEKGGKIAFFR